MTNIIENLKNFYKRNKVLSLSLLVIFLMLFVFLGIFAYVNFYKSNFSNDVNNNFSSVVNDELNFSKISKNNFDKVKLLEDHNLARKVYVNFLKNNENVITTLKQNIYQMGAVKVDSNTLTKTTYEQSLGTKKCKTNNDKNKNNDVFLNSSITSLLFRDNDNLYYKEVYNHPELGKFYVYIKHDNFKEKVIETWHYNGGDYAIKTYYKDDQSEVNDGKYFSEYLPEENHEIPNFVKIMQLNLDNKEYYIVRYITNNFDCNLGVYNATSSSTLYEDFYLSKDNYQVVKFISYIESGFDQLNLNLINEVTVNTVEEKNVNFDSIKNDFKLDANVEVKDFNLSDNSQQDSTENTKKTFDSLNISFIRPTTGNVEIGYVYVNTNFSQVQLNEFITDRKFFPKGKLGDELYNNAKQLNNNATNNDINKSDFYLSRLKLSYIFSDNRNMAWDVSVYSSFKSIDEYLSGTPKENIYRFSKNFSGKNLEVARVKVNNTISGADKYRYILFYNGYIYDFDIYNQENGNSISDISQYNIGIFDKGSKEFNILRDFVYKSI